MEILFNNNEPIYIQLKSYLEKKIICGEIEEGEKLMSVREFASEVKVNPNTVQRVYIELENEGLIYTKRGIGKFVTEEKDKINLLRRNISKDLIGKFILDIKGMGFCKEDVLKAIDEIYEEV